MGATFVKGRVIRRNNVNYAEPDGLTSYGRIEVLPTPGAGGDPTDGNFWATPIVDQGIFDGFNFEPRSDANKPHPQSFGVFRLITHPARSVPRNTWYVLGDVDEYIKAASDAENGVETPATLPTEDSDLTPIAPEVEICGQSPITIWADNAFPVFGYGYIVRPGAASNNLPALSVSGYATIGAFVTALNTTWGTPAGGTFAAVGDTVKFTPSSADATGTIAFNFYNVEPGPSVDAGDDISTADDNVALLGVATPAAGTTIASQAWSKVSGPTGGTIATPTTLGTNVTALGMGTYVFRLTVTASDGKVAYDDVTVTREA